MQLGVYNETLSPGQLMALGAPGLLGEFQAALGLAVFLPTQPPPKRGVGTWGDLLALAHALHQHGAKLVLWPLVEKENGYWIHEGNVALAHQRLNGLLDLFERHRAPLHGVVLDLETPWETAHAIPRLLGRGDLLGAWRLLASHRQPARFGQAVAALEDWRLALKTRGLSTWAAIIPFCAEELETGGVWLQDMLETPCFSNPWDHPNLMLYNSYLPHHVPLLRLGGAAQRLVYEYGLLLRRHAGEGAAITLGSTWEGVIAGNKGLHFHHPRQLAPDVAAARAAGVRHLWLYCLEGVLFQDQALRRPRLPDEQRAWLSVLRDTPAAVPPPSPALTLARSALQGFLRLSEKVF